MFAPVSNLALPIFPGLHRDHGWRFLLHGHRKLLRRFGRKRIYHGHTVEVLPSVKVLALNRAATDLFRRGEDRGIPVAYLKSLVQVDGGPNQFGLGSRRKRHARQSELALIFHCGASFVGVHDVNPGRL